MSVDDTMRAAVEAVAKAKVAEALGGDVLGKLVDEVMQHKARSTYGGSRSEVTFFDVVVRDCIEATIRDAVREHIANHAAFKERIKELMIAKADVFAVQIVDAIVSDDWRASLNVTIDRKET